MKGLTTTSHGSGYNASKGRSWRHTDLRENERKPSAILEREIRMRKTKEERKTPIDDSRRRLAVSVALDRPEEGRQRRSPVTVATVEKTRETRRLRPIRERDIDGDYRRRWRALGRFATAAAVKKKERERENWELLTACGDVGDRRRWHGVIDDSGVRR